MISAKFTKDFCYEVGAIIHDDAVRDPNRCNMLEMNLTTSSVAWLVTGLASIHLVNLSTMMRRSVKSPDMVLWGATMSKPHTTKGHVMGTVLSA